jgi:ABC-2 type transport system permease protein
MNIFKRELKANLKPFIFWSIGLFVLVFAGMAKFTGLKEGGEAVDQMLAAFPRVIQALFGMVGVNMVKLPGYYAVIEYYALVCAAIYAISLGANAVGRESIDKTYEFIFTKPCSRSKVLSIKLIAGLVYLLGFCLLNYAFSVAAINSFKLEPDISKEIILFTITLVLIGLLFYSISAMLAALIKRTEKGYLYGNLIFVAMFLLGMLYDMLENAEALRYITPLRYFIPAEILSNELNLTFVIITLALTIVFTFTTFYAFNKKDLQASN